jgi:hypothetical protein
MNETNFKFPILNFQSMSNELIFKHWILKIHCKLEIDN